MKKTILTYGIIGGAIVTAMMWLTLASGSHDFDNGMWIGYTTMVIALSGMFFGIRSYRDKHLNGSITFGKAFLMGLGVALITSTMYVASWLVLDATSDKDFMTEYMQHEKASMEKKHVAPETIAAEMKKMAEFAEQYKNPVVKVGATYAEILPVGVLVSLICAALLRRRTPATDR